MLQLLLCSLVRGNALCSARERFAPAFLNLHPAIPSTSHNISRPFQLSRRMASEDNSASVEWPETVDLSATPKAGQIVLHEGKEYETIQEGLAYIITPRLGEEAKPVQRPSRKNPKQKVIEGPQQSVFYNPIQQFNRDLTVLAIRAFGEHLLEVKKQKKERKSESRRKAKKRKRGDVEEKEENGAEPTNAKVKHIATDELVENGDADMCGQDTTESKAPEPAPQFQERKIAFSVLDALSASGLRALRYAKEIPFTTRVVSNDLSESAIESMKMNIKHNGVEHKVHPNTGDACEYMYSLTGPLKQGGKFDVIDLDPYGTAAPFMDAAVQSVTDGGMLCVTCTDAGVFASNGYPEKTYALYGGTPIKGPQSHEGGLRLVVHALATAAAKYGLAVEPLLSLSVDFYVRVFVRVHKSPQEVKFRAGKTMVVYNCDNGCGAWTVQPIAVNKKKRDKKGDFFYCHGFSQAPTATQNCEHCGFKTHLAGPMWGGPLHNSHFIQKILDLLPGADREIYQTIPRIEGMLTSALEEDLDLGQRPGESSPKLDTDNSSNKQVTKSVPSAMIPYTDPTLIDRYPFFINPSYLARVLHTHTISEDALRGALRHLGYRSTRSHTKPGSIRTDAPWDVIWEIMREWVRQKSPIKEGAIKEGTPGAGIMAKSRERDNEKSSLSMLRKDILAAVDSGKDVSDLTTKIESALYRSNVRNNDEPEASKQESATEDQQQEVNGKESPSRAASPTAQVDSSRVHPNKLEVVFDEALGREAQTAHRKKRLVRYQMNPKKCWGPMPKAK